ncbi:MAG: sigma-70 family RNA polymerase sigma factor [Terracidiphilus sp.]
MRLPVWKRKSMLVEAIAERNQGQALLKDRRQAFLRLMEQYEPALRRLTTGYADAQADREDLFQEIAIDLWQALGNYRGEASERTWLYRIAHNVAISASMRIRNRARKETTLPEGEDFRSPAASSEDAVLGREKHDLLARAIRSQPMLDRQLILLHLEGLNYAQIEEVSGMSQSAIGSRLSRLRDRLRERIQAGGGGSDGR